MPIFIRKRIRLSIQVKVCVISSVYILIPNNFLKKKKQSRTPNINYHYLHAIQIDHKTQRVVTPSILVKNIITNNFFIIFINEKHELILILKF